MNWFHVHTVQNKWTNKETNNWTNSWMNYEWMNKWMNQWTNKEINIQTDQHGQPDGLWSAFPLKSLVFFTQGGMDNFIKPNSNFSKLRLKFKMHFRHTYFWVSHFQTLSQLWSSFSILGSDWYDSDIKAFECSIALWLLSNQERWRLTDLDHMSPKGQTDGLLELLSEPKIGKIKLTLL